MQLSSLRATRIPSTWRYSGVCSSSVRCKPVAYAVAAESRITPALNKWEEFSKHVSGEWEGVMCTFDAAGQPQQLPEHYVPSAYREWGVTLYDWQTDVSSCALPSAPGELELVCRRIMPTVGCEADAVAFVEQRAGGKPAVFSRASNSSFAPAMQLMACTARGCYMSAPHVLGPDDSKAAVEVCLVRTGADAPKAQRVRIVHNLQRDSQSGEWALHSVDVHNERYDVPYRGGVVDLCGCGGGMSPFGTTNKLDKSQLTGNWKTTSCTTFAAAGAQPIEQGPSPSGDVMCLPLGVWSRSSVSSKEGDVRIEIGVMVDNGEMRWARCEYKGGVLQHGGLGTQLRA